MTHADNAYPFTVRYDGVKNEIDAETYYQTLASITVILRGINLRLGEGQSIKISVNAEESGSFISALSILASHDLFAGGVLANLKGMVETLCELIELKKVFHRVDPDQTEVGNNGVILKDISGQPVINVSQVTNNFFLTNGSEIEALNDLGKSLGRNQEISGFEIAGGDKVVTVGKGDFHFLAEKINPQLAKRDEFPESQDLVIVKCVFEGRNRRWEFLHNGMTMSAIVTDEDFWDRIDAGEKFGKGDKLVADLKIISHYDVKTGDVIERECFVTNVRGYDHRKISPPHPKLGDD